MEFDSDFLEKEFAKLHPTFMKISSTSTYTPKLSYQNTLYIGCSFLIGLAFYSASTKFILKSFMTLTPDERLQAPMKPLVKQSVFIILFSYMLSNFSSSILMFVFIKKNISKICGTKILLIKINYI